MHKTLMCLSLSECHIDDKPRKFTQCPWFDGEKGDGVDFWTLRSG